MSAYIKENIDEFLERGIPSSMYKIIYSGLVSDLDRFSKYSLREEIFIELIRNISEHHIEKSFGLEVNYNDLINLLRHVGLADSLPYKSKDYSLVLRAHLDYLNGIKAVIEVKPLKFTKKTLPIKSGKPLAKLVFTDPGMAIAVYAFLHDIPDPYKFARSMLKEHGFPNLVEATALAHLARIHMLLGSLEGEEEPVGYIVKHREERRDGEVKYVKQSEIDGVTWFYSHKDKAHVYVPMEVKYTGDKDYPTEKYVEAMKRASIIYPRTRLIITAAFGLREIYSSEFKGLKYIVLPLPLFLALF